MPVYIERKPGIYRSEFHGTDTVEFEDKETKVKEPRYVWVFQELADPSPNGRIDAITGTSLRSKNSNAYKIAAGIVGRTLAPDDDTDKYIGKLYDVVWGPNQNERLTITGVVPVQDAPQAPTTAPEAPVDPIKAIDAEVGDLDF